MKKETNNEIVNYGELILEFIKSLPQVKGIWSSDKLDIVYKYADWCIDFDYFGKNWTELDIGDVVVYKIYDNTDLNGNLKDIYSIIEANKEDIIKTFTVDNSSKIADLKEQIDRLNNELKQLENEQV